MMQKVPELIRLWENTAARMIDLLVFPSALYTVKKQKIDYTGVKSALRFCLCHQEDTTDMLAGLMSMTYERVGAGRRSFTVSF